ncbi:MAG: HDIG domain-containing protein [Candidatus Eiseniibacteriota bacterium]|nr:MAG: HDIG domain-containing protein [Candidatus Eisenbacteria bacterium]
MKKKRAKQGKREASEPSRLLAQRFAVEAPGSLLDVLSALRSAGFKAYVVGGSVRDLLLERPVKDWDVATDALPEQVEGKFSKTVATGKAHGTVTVLHGERTFEVTTFRRDGEYPDARHPEKVFFTDDVRVDLSRRDFTVNAIAYEPVAGEIICPHQGLSDIDRRLIRTVGDPVERFREDGLRPLRAIRFACQLDFEIEAETFQAIPAVLDRASLVSMERVRDELLKILESAKPSRGFEMMRQSGLLALFLPELEASRGVVQNEFHAYDVYWHSLHTCDAVPADKPLLRLAGLLHDLGKPSTREERDGRATFYNHQHVGAEMVSEIMNRLKFSGADRDYAVNLVDNHMFDYRSEWTDGALRRFMRRVGVEMIADAFDLRIADFLGNGLKQGFPQYLEEMRGRIERLLEKDEALSVADLAVDGRDVMRELGIGPQQRVGQVLKEFLEVVLDDPGLNTREELLGRLRKMRAGGQ